MATIKEVKSFEEIKVKIVTSFPDLKVFVTDRKSEAKGKDEIWYFDESASKPDKKIKFVTAFEDIKIEYVNSKIKAGWRNKSHKLQNRIK